MDANSSLSPWQPPVNTFRFDFWWHPPIITQPIDRENGLTKRISPVSAITWPNIRPIGIILFQHWRMPTVHKCIIRQDPRCSVSCCLLNGPVSPVWIRPFLYWLKCRHHLSSTNFASASWKNSQRFEHVLTESRNPLKRVANAILKSWVASPDVPTGPKRICTLLAWAAHLSRFTSTRAALEATLQNRRTVPDNIDNSGYGHYK